MGEALKPPFNYFGGKISLAERFSALLPPHEHYVEPFAGSLAVLLAKPPSRMETLNDISMDLVTFWKVLRDQPAELERVCAATPHSRIEHATAREDTPDELERARRTWVRLTQSRSPSLAPTGWRFHHRPHRGNSVPDDLRAFTSRMARTAARLRSVTLECRPALEIIGEYGRYPDVLFYIDPPYLGSVRGANYEHEMCSDDEHRELLEALLSCRAAVVLSGYASPLYDGLLTTWFRREIATQTGNGGDDRARTEVLWSNRPFAQGSLFDQVEAS